MRDLKDGRVIYLKGLLFLFIGVLSSVLIIVEKPSFKMALLLGLVVWGFARAYYFVFYVIEHYVDDGYKFAGLWSFVRYVCRKRKGDL